VITLIDTIIQVVLDIVESVVTAFIGKKTNHERDNGVNKNTF
jgi:hypothetical protein